MGNIEKFEAIAGQYDTPERIAVARVIADAIRKRAVGAKEKTALDYGCGTGLVGLELLNTFKSVAFVDASESMVEQVKEKLKKRHEKNAEAFCYDIMREYSEDLKTDYIILAQVLLHEKNIESLLSRLHSIINEGGHLLIVDFDKNPNIISEEVHNGFEQRELKALLEKISFSAVEAETFYRGKNIFMNQDASLFIMDAVK